jgi:predicted lipid-binding transport protein (Tim44 family)
MLRTPVFLIVGGSMGLLVGYALGRLVGGMIGGSMFGLAGAFLGPFAGWIASLIWPDRPHDHEQAANYDDNTPAP